MMFPNQVCQRRRDLLHVGGLTALGLGIGDWFHARAGLASETDSAVTAKSCILLWLDGGPSHLDLFDLKPEAPAEIRGPFQPISTNVPGIEICEQLPRTAAMMDRIALVRSMTSTLGEHNFASHYLLTGYEPSRALTYPGLPSVVKWLGSQNPPGTLPALPTNIAITRPNAMLGCGYLPESTSPFVIDGDPSKPDFRVQDLQTLPGITAGRLDRRRKFREVVEEFSGHQHQQLSQSTPGDSAFDQAFRLVQSPQARSAFDLEREPDSTRLRYGRHTLGQSCLMARRLIEAGTKFVTVTDRGWDTHENLFNRLKEGFTGGTAGKIPKLDQAYAALLDDLAERGLLDSTLVIVMGEFGRTPKLNTRGGRDHWPGAFSVALAGGGVTGGQVIGQSDSHGQRPADRPVSPADLVRTIYRLIGIDGDRELQTSDGRPVQINRDGTVIEELV
ncbi:DUF1501 domain-containing protein [Stieleria sp. TO1_6]|uniref:DUF1501 domain-containing protein n=1 Tax=Stieleria tagensis TaxID=2956795 RepID=UPI00209B9123|nr:DUF1501 domain-containing protein [Stieleria tagensis]MCO8124788.1 DUF1501 domain-containing protein [Stieleria tagensis]